jgi:hypothetical protein
MPGKLLAMAALCCLLCLPVLAGCSGDPPTVTPPIPTTDPGARATAPAGAVSWSVEPLNTKLGIGFERVAFRLNDGAGQPVRSGTIDLVFYRVTSDGATQRVATGQALYFGPTLPGGGSWVAYTEFDSSGPWVMDINGRTDDGRTGTAESQLLVSGRDGMPTYGFPPPEIETPSLADGLSLEQLSSDRSPLEMLYRQSVGEAVGQGKPALIHFGSPAHCEGDACRAAMTEIRAIATRYGERLNTVHVESRDLENPSELSEAAKAWDLPSEPWTFLFDGSGFLAVRVEGAIGNTELGLLIDRVLSGQ